MVITFFDIHFAKFFVSHVTTLKFSYITLIVTSSSSKMVGDTTFV